MVYHLFVEEINLKGSEDFIKYKDGNGLNCRSSNLMKVTRSEHNKICFERGQMVSSYKIDPSLYKNFHFAGSPDRKIICQYNHKGELINTYASQKAASEETGIMDSTICMALKRKLKTAGGYIWRYEGDLFATKKERKEIAIHHGTRKIVTQYDMKGNKIGIYFSLKEAGLATSADTTQILRSTKFKHLSAKGFFWRAGEGGETIDVAYYWSRIKKNLESRSLSVEQYDAESKLVNTYASIKEAMRKTGIDDYAIARAIKSKGRTKDGNTWKLKG